ncbi:hypothetical protein AVEN_202514-1 [Araneus ventricosus]|uniref:Uncharacterized protein n=1 Tax=Araneus ventricosus TaxID=182803 RepID=A0A4Y2XBU5_ARAVE|nr:hypothetical protein AVEN_202514-1 [Araneus ventricosus]
MINAPACQLYEREFESRLGGPVLFWEDAMNLDSSNLGGHLPQPFWYVSLKCTCKCPDGCDNCTPTPAYSQTTRTLPPSKKETQTGLC